MNLFYRNFCNLINIIALTFFISREKEEIFINKKKTSDENDIHLMISGTVGTKYAFTTALAWTIIERDRLKWNELKICVLFLTLLIFSMCSALFFLFWRVFRYRIKHIKLDTSVWFVICNLSSKKTTGFFGINEIKRFNLAMC